MLPSINLTLDNVTSRCHVQLDSRETLHEHGDRAELFDQYLAKKFPGFKRYSLEGNEALMPLLNSVLASAGASGLENCVLTMPHRGRLNVLSLLLDYPLALLLRKIQGGCDLPG